MKFTKLLVLACAAFAGVSGIALADDGTLAARQVPAKTLPVFPLSRTAARSPSR